MTLAATEPEGAGASACAAPAEQADAGAVELPARAALPRRALPVARWHLGLRSLLRLRRVLLLLPLLLILAFPFLVMGRDITAPGWVRARVESAAAAALGGGTLRFDSIAVRLPRDPTPRCGSGA